MKIFKKTSFLLFLVANIVSILACNTLDHDGLIPLNPDEIAGRLEGVWKSKGYGFVLDIRNGVVTSYDVTETSAVAREYFYKESTDVQTWKVFLSGNDRFFVYKSRDFELEITFEKLDDLPEVCKPGKLLKTLDAKVNFDVLWQTFKEHYAFFQLRGITNWDELKLQFRDRVTQENLYETFKDMLSPFLEDHVGVIKPNGESFQTGLEPLLVKKFYADFQQDGGTLSFEEYVREIQGQVLETITEKYLNKQVTYDANDKVMWGILEGNIGYLGVMEMSGYSDPFVFEKELTVIHQTMKQVMADLKDTKGLVIDIRFNGGGRVEAADEIASWFASERLAMAKVSARDGEGYVKPYTIYFGPSKGYVYSKPVVILTSEFTASASEYFLLAMKRLPHKPLLVGENSNGVFSQTLKTLPNGWTVSMSNERVYDMEGRIYEKSGIPVDLEVRLSSREDRKVRRDSGLDHAVKLLR